MAAFSPEVPEASRGRVGLFSHTSTPCTSLFAREMSYPGTKMILPRNLSCFEMLMIWRMRSWPAPSAG